MKKLLLLFTICFLFSCKKNAVDTVTQIDFGGGILGLIKPISAGVNQIDLVKDGKHVYIKEVITSTNSGLRLVQYASLGGNIYHSFKIDAQGSVTGLQVLEMIPSFSVRRDLIEPIPTIEIDRYAQCMKRYLNICMSEQPCKSMFALGSVAMSLGWSLRCVW